MLNYFLSKIIFLNEGINIVLTMWSSTAVVAEEDVINLRWTFPARTIYSVKYLQCNIKPFWVWPKEDFHRTSTHKGLFEIIIIFRTSALEF